MDARAGLWHVLLPHLIVDIFSRKIVGWEVHGVRAQTWQLPYPAGRAGRRSCIARPLVLHADNGSPMKGAR